MAKALRKNPGMKVRVWGPLAPVGLILAFLVFAADQAHKWWMLRVFKIAEGGTVEITPFFDLVLVWNKGVSYGLLNTDNQWIFIVLNLLICAVLWAWMCGLNRPISAAAIGLILGGALGNIVDRLLYGAVADFFHLHWGGWSWYVFNVADLAIVAGVALLLYESLPRRGGVGQSRE
jgi:signal peptidase II